MATQSPAPPPGLVWDLAGPARGSPLVLLGGVQAFCASLLTSPNVWGTAIRAGCAAGKDVPDSKGAAPRTLLVLPDGTSLSDGSPIDTAAVRKRIASSTRTDVTLLECLPPPDKELAAGEPFALVVTALECAGAVLELLATPRVGSAMTARPGCCVVVVGIPLEGVVCRHKDSLQVVFPCDREAGKDVASLTKWAGLRRLLETTAEGRQVRGFAVQRSGGLVVYPDGEAEALMTAAAKFQNGAGSGKGWDALEEDKNAYQLLSGFAPFQSPYTVAARWLAGGDGMAFTGAGISKESGVPTFRDGDGLWERYDAMEVSSISGLAGEPAKVWEFEREFNDILNSCSGPNAGHVALAELEAAGCVDLVITQNVDGFQQAAGSKRVLELHGSEVHAICLNSECGHRVEMKDIFREGVDDLWSPWAHGWGVRWPARPDDSELQRGVRAQLEAVQRPSKKRRGDAAPGAGGAGPPSPKGGLSPLGSSGSSSDSSSGSSCSSSGGSSSSGSCPGPQPAPRAVDAGPKPKRIGPKPLNKACAAKALSDAERLEGPPRCRIPICPKCKAGVLKPDGIYFGEPLEKAVLRRSIGQSVRSKVVVMVGTSCTVDPAAKLPVVAKKCNGAKVVEVNIRETRLSRVADVRLWGPSAEVLPKLSRLVRAQLGRAPPGMAGANPAGQPAD